MAKIKVNYHLDKKHIDLVKKTAKRLKISESALIRKLIEEYA